LANQKSAHSLPKKKGEVFMKTAKYILMGLLLLSWGFSSAFAAVDAETESASKSLGAAMASEVSFDEGKASLNESAQNEIRGIINSAKEKGKIDELKVAVWADREYPVKDTKVSKADIDLAKKRADSIKSFIKREMKVGVVHTYNMTERPNALQKFLKTPQEKVKTTMEASGAAPRTSDETGIFGQKAKASKAVIMIYIK
jgi:hypothetical protein